MRDTAPLQTFLFPWDLKTAVCHMATEDVEVLSDEHLMTLLKSCDQPALVDTLFAELYRRFHPRVAAWCERLTRDAGSGMDLAQEVFLKAWRYRCSFRGDARVSTWLYAIARNHCLTAIQKLAIDPLARSTEFPAHLDDKSNSVHAHLQTNEAFERLWEVINQSLTAMEKRVMALHFGHDLTLDAITRACGLSNPSGAKAYIVNAKRKLRRALGDEQAYAERERKTKSEWAA